MEQIQYSDFEKIEIRTGTIIRAEAFDRAKRPAYKLTIDFGDYGIKQSSAQITDRYLPESLPGRQIVAVINFPVKQIANYFSECLVLGAVDADGKVVLLQPDAPVQNGLRIA